MSALEKHDTISMPSRDSKFMVTLADSDDPQRMSTIRRWIIVIIISFGTLLVTCASSMVRESLVGLFSTLTHWLLVGIYRSWRIPGFPCRKRSGYPRYQLVRHRSWYGSIARWSLIRALWTQYHLSSVFRRVFRIILAGSVCPRRRYASTSADQARMSLHRLFQLFS